MISSDFHVPYHDVASYSAFKHFLRYLRPDYHIIAGDFLDSAGLSTFSKDPNAVSAEIELEMANQVLDELYEASPNSITKFIAGNHSKRLERRLWETPELIPFVTKGKTPLQVLAGCLSLDERGIEYFDYPAVYMHWGFAITHGEATSLHSARKELDTHGVSGASGHTHRAGMWVKHDRAGTKHWYSLGGLCSREVGYRPNNNWNQSVGVLFQVVGTELYTFYQVPIVKSQFIWEKSLFTQDGRFESK